MMIEKYFKHESSFVDDGCAIGNNTKIWHFCHIMSGAIVGENCILGQNVHISGNAKIGNNCKIQNNVSIYDCVEIEDNVFCGPSCVFTNVINPRSFIERKTEYKKTLVKTGATIGANATIICGVIIGKYALVGAGSVVTKDVPDYGLVMGVPAKLKGWVCQCGCALDDIFWCSPLPRPNLVCKECKKEYQHNLIDYGRIELVQI
jgi:UDP-2-acetamido-3-amino-2,3-dideoxy-glucuronate N-acetyltransferase